LSSTHHNILRRWIKPTPYATGKYQWVGGISSSVQNLFYQWPLLHQTITKRPAKEKHPLRIDQH
jgi:hypothetical protein